MVRTCEIQNTQNVWDTIEYHGGLQSRELGQNVWEAKKACATAVEIARQQRAVVPQFQSSPRCHIEIDSQKKPIHKLVCGKRPFRCRVSQIEHKSKNNSGIHEHLRVVKNLSIFEIKCILGSRIWNYEVESTTSNRLGSLEGLDSTSFNLKSIFPYLLSILKALYQCMLKKQNRD